MKIYHGVIFSQKKAWVSVESNSIACIAENIESAFEMMDEAARKRWSGFQYSGQHVDRNTVCQIPDDWIDRVIEARNP